MLVFLLLFGILIFLFVVVLIYCIGICVIVLLLIFVCDMSVVDVGLFYMSVRLSWFVLSWLSRLVLCVMCVLIFIFGCVCVNCLSMLGRIVLLKFFCNLMCI